MAQAGGGGDNPARARMSERNRKRLFQPFRKSAHDAANSAAGVGLGRALSRRLARDMGGELSLEKDAAGGACFVLTLRAVES